MTVDGNRRVMIMPSVDHGAALLGSSRLSLSSDDSKETGRGDDEHYFADFHDVSSCGDRKIHRHRATLSGPKRCLNAVCDPQLLEVPQRRRWPAHKRHQNL
jgi:hypothetical protein